MKNIRRLAATLVVSTMTLAATSSTANAQPGKTVTPTARATSVKGKVRYSTDHKTWSALKEGGVVVPGSLIQTADKAQVDMNLGGPGNVVRIFDGSVLGIDTLGSDTQLDLRAGQIAGTVKKLSPDSKYEIKFPTGVAGVGRGSYQISSDGALSVREGVTVIAITQPGGAVNTKAVNAGQHFDPKTGMVADISAAEREKTSKRETKPVPKPTVPSQPPRRPGI